MRFSPTPIALAIATTLGAGVALPTQAALITSATTGFSGSANVTDTCGPLNATACGTGPTPLGTPLTLATPTLSQFSASTGVLMGTTIELTSTRTQTISGSLANGIGTKTVGTKTFPGSKTTGAGTSNAQIAAPGVIQSLGTISKDGSATVPADATTASFGPTSDGGTATNTSLPVGSGDLNSYVGGGTVTVNLTAPTLFQADSTWSNGNKNSTSSTATYKLDWSGDVTAEYEYLLHADASFDGAIALVLNLDFGTLFLGELASPLDFSIFNAAGERVGLDLDSFFGSGDTGILTTDLALFTALAAGSNSDYLAYFDTSGLGSFAASYILNLSDEDVGASSSRFNDYSLTLNLMGTVIERQSNGVPEPGMLALLGIGLFGLAMSRRRLC